MSHLLKPFLWFWFLCFIAMLSPHFGGVMWLYGFLLSFLFFLVWIAIVFIKRDRKPHPDGW